MTRKEAIDLIGSAEALDACRERWSKRMGVPSDDVPNNVIFLSEEAPTERDLEAARAWYAERGL